MSLNFSEIMMNTMIQMLEATKSELHDEEAIKEVDALITEGKAGIALGHLYDKLAEASIYSSVPITDDEFEAIDYYSKTVIEEMNKDKAVDIIDNHLLTNIRAKMVSYAAADKETRAEIGFELPTLELLFLQTMFNKYMEKEVDQMLDKLKSKYEGGEKINEQRRIYQSIRRAGSFV